MVIEDQEKLMPIKRRQRAEEVLRDSNTRLEQRVIERTADLAQANRMLNILRACNQAVIRATEELLLLQEICQIIVNLGGYPLVWVGFAEKDTARSVHPVAQAGFEEGYLKIINLTWADTECGQGPTGTSIRSGQPCIARDIRIDPNFTPWREEALRRGYASSISLPLHDKDHVFGVLNIYATVPDAFHAEEVRLLMELAGDLAFGITSLRERAACSRAEAALRQNEVRYRAISDFTYDWEYWIGPDGHYIYISPSCQRITGYPAEEFLQDPTLLERIVHPDDCSLVAGHLEQDRLYGNVSAIDFRIITRSGEERWIGHCCQPVYDSQGQNLGQRCSNRDITERKQAEEERKAHIHFLESLEQIDQAIKQEMDVEQMLWHIIRTVFSIFGCDRAWLFYPCDPDTPFFRVPVEVTRPEYPGAQVLNVDIPMSPGEAQNLREALKSDDPVTYTTGTERTISTATQFSVQSQMFVPLFPKLGKPWVFGMHQCSYPRIWTNEEKKLFKEISRRISDGLSSALYLRELQESNASLGAEILERKRAEAEILRLNASLEQRIQERTNQLESANHELEAFSYSVSHDLRAPLRSIAGFSQILLEDYSGQLDSTAQNYLNRIHFAIQHMSHLIDALLKLARITRSEMQIGEVDLCELARTIMDELRSTQPERQVDVRIPAKLILRADLSLINIVLDNLLRNAWKFTRNCLFAQIELGSFQKDGKEVFFVRDNGIGFDMVYANKLFRPFERLHGSQEYEGTGIGLAMVNRIIQRHGGQVWAEGEIDKGATFYFNVSTG
jgi:PAS domain S-box-containing protein